jgi:hypothetical protein
MAKDRGVDIYWFTWNAFIGPLEGKDGITSDKTAPRTIEYYRAAVRETIKTYPLLAGMGITAGEVMPEAEFKQISKEQWLWRTYGEGIRDGLKDTPDRKFRLIHRFHMAGLTEIQTAFAELPCPLDLSYKYAIAHMYSVPNPSMNAAKIRGACDLALFDKSGDTKQQVSAVRHLEAALTHWKNYVGAYTRQYVQPVRFNRAGLVDLPKQTEDVAADVQMARDWKTGTIDETQIKRSGTEAGFRR